MIIKLEYANKKSTVNMNTSHQLRHKNCQNFIQQSDPYGMRVLTYASKRTSDPLVTLFSCILLHSILMNQDIGSSIKFYYSFIYHTKVQCHLNICVSIMPETYKYTTINALSCGKKHSTQNIPDMNVDVALLTVCPKKT